MNLSDEAIEAAARAHDVERKQWFLRRNNMNPPGVQWEICRYGDPGKDEIFVKGTAPTYDRGVVAFIEMRNAAAMRAAAPFLVPEGWTEQTLRDLAAEAYEAGCIDTHNNYQPDRAPDFSEAARDYVLYKFPLGKEGAAVVPSDSELLHAYESAGIQVGAYYGSTRLLTAAKVILVLGRQR